MGKKQESATRDYRPSGEGEFPMQFIALDAATIVPGDGESRLKSGARLSYEVEAPEASCVLHSRFYVALDSGGGFSRLCEPVEEAPAEDDQETGVTGWKRAVTWTGAAIVGWAIVLGCFAIVRALLS